MPQIATFIATAALAQVATVYLLAAFGLEAIAENPVATVSIAVGLIALSAAIAVRGIELAAWVQYALIGLQIVAIGGFCVGAFLAIGSRHRTRKRRAGEPGMVQPVCRADPSGLVAGVILCAVHLLGMGRIDRRQRGNHPSFPHPGPRGHSLDGDPVGSVRDGPSVAALGFGGVDLLTSDEAIGDVLSVIGPLATGEFFGRIITLAIGMSALSALFTVAVASPRSWLSMATYRALPKSIGTVESEEQHAGGSPRSGGPA